MRTLPFCGLVSALALCHGAFAAKPLDYVPSDTPYLFAGERRASADQLQTMQLATSGLSLENVRYQLRASRTELAGLLDLGAATAELESAAQPAEDDGEPDDEHGDANSAPDTSAATQGALQQGIAVLDLLIEEFDSMRQWSDISRLGMEADALFAFYGNGLLPVMRMELGNLDRLKAFIERVETAGQFTFAQWGNSKQPMWALEIDKIAWVIAISDDHIVTTLLPIASSAKERELILAKPSKALGHAGMKRFNREQNVLGLVSGYVDFRRIAEILTRSPGPAEQVFIKHVQAPWPSYSETCQSELQSTAAIAPRITFGFTRFDKRAIDARAVWELRSDLAGELLKLSTSAPPLEQQTQLVSMTLAFDPIKTIEFIQRKVAAVAEQPYVCEDMLELNNGIADIGKSVSQLPPALLLGLQGVAFSLEQLELSESFIPSRMEMSAAVQTTQPAMLLGWLQMTTPQISQSGLLPDGKPVTLNDLDLGPIIGKLSLVQTEHMLAGATGPDAAARLKALVDAPAIKTAPLLSMRFTGGFYRTIAAVVSQLDDTAGMDQAELEHLKRLLNQLAEELESADLRMSLTTRGVEFYQNARLAK